MGGAENEDDGDDDKTIVPRSRAPVPSVSRVSETVYAVTSVPQTEYSDNDANLCVLFD